MAPHPRTVENALWAVENALWAVENAMKINPGKSKVTGFTRARVKNSLNYFWGDQRIPEESSCKYSGIIISSDLSRADQINYIAQKAWKALRFLMRILQKGKQ
jgi:hypothetical protein